MGLKIIRNKNSFKINNIEYRYGELLLDFIYKDYSPVLSYIKQNLIDLHLLEESLPAISNASNDEKLEKEQKLKNELQLLKLVSSDKITNFNEKNFVYADLSELLKDFKKNNNTLDYENVPTFLNNIIYNNPYFKDENFKNDPFFTLFIYEFFKLYSNLNIDKSDLKDTLLEVKKIMCKLQNLQDLYYEALNICFNTSHKNLRKFPITARVEYYSNLPYGINALKHLTNNCLFSEQFVVVDDDKTLNINLFNEDENYLNSDIEIYPPSTDVDSRLNKVFFNSTSKEIIHTHHKNYNIPQNTTLEKLTSNTYNVKNFKTVLDFNNLLSLCSYEFFKMVENKDTFSIQECKLCMKMFMKNPKSKKEYCHNSIFSDSNAFNNKHCSDKNVGNKIISETAKKSNELQILYDKVYKRLHHRSSPKDKNAFKDLVYFYQCFSDNTISSTNFEIILNEFNLLKPNTYKKELLSDEVKLIVNNYIGSS